MPAVIPALAIFFGSFLLFGIQPMLGRTLLPPFGGSSAVWSVCLAAYQVLLLAGYGYAHLLSKRGARAQRRLHLGLLAASVLWAFAFAALRLLVIKGHIGNSAAPSLEVLFCVTLFVGLPYVLLSANSTLIQAWLARAASAPGGVGEKDARSIYRLYAVSNLGSLLGLLTYPFLIEPFVSLNAQWYGFACCLLVYTALLAFVGKGTQDAGLGMPNRPPTSDLRLPASGLPAPLTRAWLWFALPALSTFLLNAITAHLSTDISPVPLMWVLLLTAYLLTYILGFSFIGEKGLIAWSGLAVLTLLGAAIVTVMPPAGQTFLPNLVAGVLLMLVCGTCLHGWLYRIRPDTSRLTHFYLGIAAGGAAGGVGASLLAPALFNRVWEYPLVLIAATGACAWLLHTWNHKELKGLNTFLLFCASVAVFLVVNSSVREDKKCVLRMRNFYGCLRVDRDSVKSPVDGETFYYQLFHGETLHGFQIVDRFLKNQPTSYYGPVAGGLAVTSHPGYTNNAVMRVGVIGLGIGTLACYGRTNDLYRFYEINPQVIAVATDTNYFSYVTASAAKVELALGDARKSLEREQRLSEPKYDVLIVDAYSGDSVPFHLATQEAFQLYRDRLLPDGILAVHVSNWHMDLLPLCKAQAQKLGWCVSGSISQRTNLTGDALWVYMTSAPLRLNAVGFATVNWNEVPVFTPPMDERGSLLALVRFGSRPPVQTLELDFGLRH